MHMEHLSHAQRLIVALPEQQCSALGGEISFHAVIMDPGVDRQYPQISFDVIMTFPLQAHNPNEARVP